MKIHVLYIYVHMCVYIYIYIYERDAIYILLDLYSNSQFNDILSLTQASPPTCKYSCS